MKTPTKKMKGGLINRGSGFIKTADIIIEAIEKGQPIPSTDTITSTKARKEYNEMVLMFNDAFYTANPQTELTYSRLYEQYKNMTTNELVIYMNKQTTSGGYYKKRAGLKRAIARAWADDDLDLVKRLTVGYRFHVKPEKFTRRESKRADNSTIVADWRTKFIGKLAKSNSKYKNHALLCYLCGMRPEEFTPDLGATVFFDGDKIKVAIKGAKVKIDANGNHITGVSVRNIVFDANTDDPAIEMLLALKDETTFKTEIKFPPVVTKQIDGMPTYAEILGHSKAMKKGLASLMGTLGKGLLGKETKGRSKGKPKVFTAYNLRHMFASGLRASGMSINNISRALGHMSEATQRFYGRANAPHSGGGVIPTSITSKENPRAAKVGKTPWRGGTGAVVGVVVGAGTTKDVGKIKIKM
jgi:integrase